MAGNNNFHANLPVFDGKNCDMWVKQMKVIFTFQEVYEQGECKDRSNPSQCK
jgi:hypothetical protein